MLRSALLCPPMSWLVVAAVCVYFIAYGFYGLFVANRTLGVDAARLTPADRHNDWRATTFTLPIRSSAKVRSTCCLFRVLFRTSTESGTPLAIPEAHMRWRGLAVILLLALALSLASCATQTVPNVHRPPGFLMGLLHGFISLFSLIGSLFFDTRIYGFPNSGSGYDVGFVLGAAVFYGGIAGLVAGRSRAKASA